MGYVYILTNAYNTVLYIGVTSDLVRRIAEHGEGSGSAFTSKYKCHKLVYYEVYQDIESAIDRETQLKWWCRKWKEQLIESLNPDWKDLGVSIASNPLLRDSLQKDAELASLGSGSSPE